MFRVHLSTDVHTSEVCLARRRPCAVMLPCAPQRASSPGQHRSSKRLSKERRFQTCTCRCLSRCRRYPIGQVAAGRDASGRRVLRVGGRRGAGAAPAGAPANAATARRLSCQRLQQGRRAEISAQAALTKQISPGAIVSSIGEVTAQAASAAPPPWPPLAIDSGSSQKCLWTATCERGQMTLLDLTGARMIRRRRLVLVPRRARNGGKAGGPHVPPSPGPTSFQYAIAPSAKLPRQPPLDPL